MTNLILTVIGIVLAAIAAMVAFDYGGDYFLEGYARAEAATISNAGNNVGAAYSVFGVQRRRPPSGLRELTSSPQGRSLLKRIPQVQDLGVVREEWMGLDRGAGPERAFVVEGLSLRLCRTLNQRLNGFADNAVIPGAPAFKSGCFAYNGTTVNVYYTFLGGVPEGGAIAPYSPVTPGAPLPPPPPSGGGNTGIVDDDAAWPSVPENSPPPLARPTPVDPAPVTDGGWVECGPQDTVCRFDGEATVRFGEGSSYYYLTSTGQASCTSAAFGGDPSEGAAKSCSYRIIPQQDGWSFCANEGMACSFGKKMRAEVRYGSLGSYVVKKLVDGSTCSTATMGSDPAAGRGKACYYRNVEAVPVPPPVPEVPLNPTVGVEACTTGGIVGTATKVDFEGAVGTVLPSRMCRGDAVLSPGGRFRLTMQTDGNLVLAAVGADTSMWAANPGEGDSTYFAVQPDGNAVLYNNSNTARWSSGTYGWRGTMRLSSDGNLAIYDADATRVVWETRTDVCLPRSVSGGAGSAAYGRASTLVPSRLCNNEYVDSPDGRFRLTMQADGNLALATGDDFSDTIWSSGTSGKGPYKLNVQTDGNSVLYGRDGNAKWSTGTNGWNGARMMVETDGNLTVWNAAGDRLLWETRTDRCLPTRIGDGRRTGDFGVSGTVVPSRICNNEFVESPDGRFRLIMQPDGDLSLRMGDAYETQIWHSGTTDAYKMDSQSGGNMVLSNRSGNAVWSTGTNYWNGARMSVQSDGNLVVRDADNARILWESHSVYCLPAERTDGTRVGDFGVNGSVAAFRVCNNEYVTSPNGRFRLSLRPDGNVVLGMGAGFSDVIWQTNTSDPYRILTQGNGDVRLTRRDGSSTSMTGTSYNDGARLVVQDDGNLVVRSADNSRLLWETHSAYCLPRETSSGTNPGDYDVLGARVPDRLCNNEYVTSPNGSFRLTMRPDGNLVVATGTDYDKVVWQSGTSGFYRLLVQGNGDVRLYSRDGNSRSVTGTPYNDGARLFMQDDGNLVVRSRDNSRLLWQSNSIFCTPAERGVGTIEGGYGVTGAVVGPRVCTNEYVTSPNKRFRLTMRPDGNLVLAQGSDYSDVIWSTGTSDYYGVSVQGNGDVRLYARDGNSRAVTGTPYNDGARFAVQDDGNLVVRSSDNTRLIWETRSDRCLPAEVGGELGKDNLGVSARLVRARICNNEYVTSPNGRFRLTMKADGDLTIGMGDGYQDVIWNSGTAGRGGYKLEAQGDGNMVIYDRAGNAVWSTGTPYNGGARLMLNDLGNLIVMKDASLLWESRSDRCLPASISAGVETAPGGQSAARMPFVMCQGEWVDSPNGRFRLTLNAQGDLQLMDGVNHDVQLWHSGTNDPSIYRFFSWGDGNHWLMDRSGRSRWSTGTSYNNGARLLVQDDGNVAVYSTGGSMLWQTGTGGRTGPTPGSPDDLALNIRKAGSDAYRNAAAVIGVVDATADIGMDAYDYRGVGTGSIYRISDRTLFEVRISGDRAGEICASIAKAVGGDVSDRSAETTTPEGCAGFSSGYYYWRRIDDAQADGQARFVRSFGAAVFDGAKAVKAVPTSLDAVGMAGAERYDLLGGSGFEAAGENWQFYIRMESLEACRLIDQMAGNGTRAIDRGTGFSYVLDEGCGGEGGNLYYFRNVNAAYDTAIATRVMSLADGAVSAAFSNGGPTSSTGRDAAAAFLASGVDGYGFVTRTGIYPNGDFYTAELRVASAAACRRLDVLSSNGDRGADLTYDPANLKQGCGRYGDGTYWFWRRLDERVAPGTVFDAKAMFSMDANDDASGIWNYLESDPAGGADIPLMNKGGCWWGDCVRGDVDALHIANTNVTRTDGTSLLDASTLHMHPGPDRDALLRFRAPVTGWYRVAGRLEIGDSSPTGINVDWGQGSYYMDANTRSFSFDYMRRFVEGETLNFRVNRGDRYNNDGTHINATLTYMGVQEPPAQNAGTGHRFWRVLGSRANGDSDVIAAAELEFRGVPGGPSLTTGAGGTPIASSQYGGDWTASRAFDGDPSTAWASVNANMSFLNQWIGYDFGAGKAVDVKQVAWRGRGDSIPQTIGAGRVQWSDDGSTWSTSFNFVTAPATQAGQTLILSPTTVLPDAHRYWRVKGYAINDPYMRASEIEMRETADGPNVARYGTPLASSYYGGGYQPFYAFNGTTSGNAWATTGGLGWIGVDMLVPRAINEFRYASAEGPKAPTDFALEWSDDAVSWTQAWRQKYTAWGNTELRTFTRPDPNAPKPPPVVATSVVVTSALGGCIQIAELEAYAGGANVALAANGGVATGSAPYDSSAGVGRINDGVKPASYPNIFHSQCGGGDFAKVTFAKPVTLESLSIYGRADCCGSRDLFNYVVYNGTTQVAAGQIDARSGAYGDDVPSATPTWTLAGEYPSVNHFEYTSSEGVLAKDDQSSWWRKPGYTYWGVFAQDAATVVMHPGPGATQATIVNFVAPADGMYSFDGGFAHGTCGGDGVVTQVGGLSPVTLSPCTSTSFSFTRAMKAGDRLPFSVSNNGTDSSDSTSLKLSVRPL